MSKNALTIGRNPNNDWILNDKSVEEYHAEIRALDNSLQLIDLQSKLGVIVNGKKVSQHQLSPGDVVQIGFQQLDWESKTNLLVEQKSSEDSQAIKPEQSQVTLDDDLNRFLREMASTSPQDEVEIKLPEVSPKTVEISNLQTETKPIKTETNIDAKLEIDVHTNVQTIEKTPFPIKPKDIVPDRLAEIRVVKGTSIESSDMPISNFSYYVKIIAMAVLIAAVAIFGGYFLSSYLNQ